MTQIPEVFDEMIKARPTWSKTDLVSTSNETSALSLDTTSDTFQGLQPTADLMTLTAISVSTLFVSIFSHYRLITLDSWRMAPSNRDTLLLTNTGSSLEDLFSSTPATRETSPGSATTL